MKKEIQKGDKIYHPEYGFGTMKELPTFKGMQVTGIRNACIPASDVMELVKLFWEETATLMDEYRKEDNEQRVQGIVDCRILISRLQKQIEEQ